jgi:glycosyltransferase involved in cell wall biosynthesis
MAAPSLPLSVAIITFNEEDRLPDCLRSSSFADDIVVVDSGSADATVEIAKAAGCRVFVEEWKGFGLQKQSAVDKCSNDWVLVLDSDERIPPETRDEIARVLKDPAADGYSFPRKNIFNGKWIRSCGWWPDYVVRLFRKERGELSRSPVHEKIVVKGPVVCLKTPIEHHPIRNMAHIMAKMDGYSTLGAETLFERGASASVLKAVSRGSFAFLKMYFLKRGVLDGAEGLALSFSHGATVLFKYLKLREKIKAADAQR